jgi:hypothetical protein
VRLVATGVIDEMIRGSGVVRPRAGMRSDLELARLQGTALDGRDSYSRRLLPSGRAVRIERDRQRTRNEPVGNKPVVQGVADVVHRRSLDGDGKARADVNALTAALLIE